MIKLILDGEKIMDRNDLHRCFAEKLSFPQWYGKNLDALFDFLTVFPEDVEISFLNKESLEKHLGAYTKKLYQVLEEAKKENPRLLL